jgi:nicotinic acid mononucleotide adenylyltransferase
LDYLSSVHGEYDFYFCLGADSFIDLVNGKWQQTDRILNDLLFNPNVNTSDRCNKYQRRLVVLYRSQTKIVDENDASKITSKVVVPSTCSSEYYDNLQKLVEEFGVQLIHMDRSEDNISSTFARNCSDVSKLQGNPAVILPEVLQYIQRHKLYHFCK